MRRHVMCFDAERMPWCDTWPRPNAKAPGLQNRKKPCALADTCCENVCIEDIAGDVDDLVGAPLLMAEEVTSVAEEHESGTWTFYKFATINGFVTVRWLGTSNGYYSESVDFEEVE